MEALPQAIEGVDDPEAQVILQHILLSKKPGTVTDRYRKAARELGSLPEGSVRGRETAALESLTAVLTSDSFVAAFNERRGIEVGPIDVDDHGLGYIYREKTMRVIIDPDDERKQRHIHRFQIVATRPGIRVVAHRFLWTGTDTSHPVDHNQAITALSAGHSYLGTRIEYEIIGPPPPLNFFHLGKVLRSR